MGFANVNFDLNIGASFECDFTWLFPDEPENPKSEFNTPQDLTGWTGSINGPDLAGFPLDLTLGGINGTISGLILDTTTWEKGTYEYEMEMTAPDSSVDVILKGKVCVRYVPQFADPTPAPTYALSTSATPVDEGDSFTITLTTTDVADSTLVPYTVTGVDAEDVSEPLTGNFTVVGNSATTVFNVVEDATTEGEETFTLTLDGLGESVDVVINDTSFDPEAGLTLTNSFAPSGEIDTVANLDDNVPVVFAVDFTGLTDASGFVAEFGGADFGAYIGFDSNNDFLVRCGAGSSRWDSNTAYVLESSNKPSGDGTLVVEFVPGTPVTARVWWNGAEVGVPVNGGVATTWVGIDESAFLANRSGSNASIVVDEVDAATTGYTTASNLRYYENQTVAP